MTPTERKAYIEKQLQKVCAPTYLEVIDESHLHRGHPGAATGASHFAVTIVAPCFAGLSAVKSHQLIYDALSGMIPAEIHALRIKASSII